ncbi:MAG: hypothetical protein HUK21_12440 [Fibrobacteraceae bacterium]|nr:hypothetical protein [Fibrobacteraceae bacterium]
MEKRLEEMKNLELRLFIIEFYRASQLDRSFSKENMQNKGEFKEALVETCLLLIKCVDKGTLKNSDIRKKIKQLTSIDKNISYGQAQKVVNVVLKQYVFLTKKWDFVKELDCPLDSIVMKGCGIKNNTMKSVTEEDYLAYQKKFEADYDGNRVLKDLDYDKNRNENFSRS